VTAFINRKSLTHNKNNGLWYISFFGPALTKLFSAQKKTLLIISRTYIVDSRLLE
jgi:hypothetical protein